MSFSKIYPALLVGALIVSASCSMDAGPEEPERDIVNIAGDLYRVQDNSHFTLFLVTEEGIILADPLNAEFAAWLEAELEQRFGQPVRYVLYSHHHWDHASGARVFDDTAVLVGHENFAPALALSISDFPVQVTIVDSNGDRRLSREEATGDLGVVFDELDANADEFLDGGEILADVLVPELTYSDTMTITLGGKSVHLVHPGPNHSTDASVILFEDARTIYGVDFLNVNRLALGFPGTGTLPEWLKTLRTVEALDFDIVSPGHSGVGTKADFTAYREYFEDLEQVVNDAVASGTSLENLLASDALTEYSALPNYVPQRDRNIEEAYALATGS